MLKKLWNRFEDKLFIFLEKISLKNKKIIVKNLY